MEITVEPLANQIKTNSCSYYKFHQSKKAYVYFRRTSTGRIFEVFERRTSKKCIDFDKRIYSDTEYKERCPKIKDFGVWAWTYTSEDNAIDKSNELNK